jgi:hypothetical protein
VTKRKKETDRNDVKDSIRQAGRAKKAVSEWVVKRKIEIMKKM